MDGTKASQLRPRILLNGKKAEELKEKQMDSRCVNLWEDLKRQADFLSENRAPEYFCDADSCELWQREVGDNIAALSFAAVFDHRYYEDAKQWVLTACQYPSWGKEIPDLAMGHLLFGVSVFYDWCNSYMEKETKQSVRKTLVHYARSMYEAYCSDAWWKEWLLQNHLWIDMAGLGAAGIALYHEHKDAPIWFEESVTVYHSIISALGTDGASHEGLMYWSYGLHWLLKYLDVIRSFTGENLFENEWLKKTGYYKLYLTLPRDSWAPGYSVFDFADSTRAEIEGPGFLLDKLSVEYKDGYMAYLANQVRLKNMDNNSPAWLNILWSDYQTDPVSYENLPCLRHFDDMGIVISRSGWNDNESILAFKCGPFIGHRAVEKNSRPPYTDWGGGHVHQDSNHFIFFSNGEFLVRDDGYVFKSTNSHNTLLVNGHGQLGGDSEWFHGEPLLKRNKHPYIITAYSDGYIGDGAEIQYDYMTGDAANAYDEALGLKCFKRRILFIKPNIVFIMDEVETEQETDLEINYFTEGQKAFSCGGGYIVPGEKALLYMQAFPDQNAKIEYKEVYKNISGERMKRQAFVQKRYGSKWKTAVVLCASDSISSLPVLDMADVEAGWDIIFKNLQFHIDTEHDRIVVEKGNVSSKMMLEEPEFSMILVNGTCVPGFKSNVFDYAYQDENPYRIVREGLLSTKVFLVPKALGLDITVEEKENSYCINVSNEIGQNTYHIDVKNKKKPDVRQVKVVSVTSSSKQASHLPELTIDQKYDSYWTAEGVGHDLSFGMDSLYEVTGIDIAWYKGDMRSSLFDIAVSTDGISFEVVSRDRRSSGQTTLPEYYEIKPVFARYVKVIFNGNDTGLWNSVLQLGIYERGSRDES